MHLTTSTDVCSVGSIQSLKVKNDGVCKPEPVKKPECPCYEVKCHEICKDGIHVKVAYITKKLNKIDIDPFTLKEYKK
jgi:hypothetical protein